MSDLMLIGVLRMPMDNASPLDVFQYVARGRQAADQIEADEKELDRQRVQIKMLMDDKAALMARVEGLERDAARIDWIENQWRDGVHVEVCAVGDGTTWHSLRKQACVYVGNSESYGDDIRAAIDAALKGES